MLLRESPDCEWENSEHFVWESMEDELSNLKSPRKNEIRCKTKKDL